VKTLTLLSTLMLTLGLSAQAAPLAPKQANAICRAKALRAAHFIAESNRKFLVSYKASDVYEISTPITYEFRVAGLDDAIVTVTAFAYPDDRSCTIGSIVNNIAGND
jgi:hypothetical protein